MLANANAHTCSFLERREIKPTPISTSPATGRPIKKLCQAPVRRSAGEMSELVDEVVLIVSVEFSDSPEDTCVDVGLSEQVGAIAVAGCTEQVREMEPSNPLSDPTVTAPLPDRPPGMGFGVTEAK
jgi:hypothetical protein